MCKRRWAFAYIAGQWSPSGKAAEAGKRVHAVLEVCGDSPPANDIEPWEGYDIGAMARALWKHKPDDEAIAHEEKFEIEIDGVTYKGVIDRRSHLIILDWKTTGGQLKWAKSDKVLLSDVQRLIYFMANPTARASMWVTGTWATSEAAQLDPKTQPFDTKVSVLQNDYERDAELFQIHVAAPAREISAVADGVDPLSFPMPDNHNHRYESPCKKFPPEGCPHYDTCHKKTSLSSALRSREKPMGIIQTLVAADRESTVVPVVSNDNQEYLIDTLYVDCLPLYEPDEPIVYAHTLIAKASSAVSSERQVEHPLLIDFAKGTPYVAVELISMLEDRGLVPHLFLETKSALGRGVMDTLMGRSKRVIKGMF